MRTVFQRVPVEDVPTTGDALVVVPVDTGESPLDRYLDHEKHAAFLPEERKLVGIIRTAPLATPDYLSGLEATHDRNLFTISIELRRYEGALFANVETILFIQVDLGRLEPGEYHLRAIETTLFFNDLATPEHVTNADTNTRQLTFKIG